MLREHLVYGVTITVAREIPIDSRICSALVLTSSWTRTFTFAVVVAATLFTPSPTRLFTVKGVVVTKSRLTYNHSFKQTSSVVEPKPQLSLWFSLSSGSTHCGQVAAWRIPSSDKDCWSACFLAEGWREMVMPKRLLESGQNELYFVS